MSELTHYSELEVEETASADNIRKAYRKLVLKYHPDRSRDSSTTDRFVRIAEAYRVLSDPDRRSEYDAALRYRRERIRMMQEPAAKPKNAATPRARTTARVMDHAHLTANVTQAAVLFSQGQFDHAARIAETVLRHDPRMAMAHAILADIARARQDLQGALRHYSLALQSEPENPVFARRYEEVLRLTARSSRFGDVAVGPSPAPLWATAVATLLILVYVATSRDRPLLPNFSIISTWTFGLLVMLFADGIAVGAALSVSGSVDRLSGTLQTSAGGPSLAAIISILSLGNFWLAGAVYVGIGLWRKAFGFSMSRVMTVVAILVAGFSAAAYFSYGISWSETLLWSGNVLYVGLLCGWTVADAFR